MKPSASQKQDLKTDSLLKRIQNELKPYTESPYLDALVLLSHISGLTKPQILADPDLGLTRKQDLQLQRAIADISAGIPLPYVLGVWEFFNLPFKITSDVLIPRPETEGLVELVLIWLENNPDHRNVLEIGTGSGCIAISLAKQVPNLTITATDISKKALAIARQNAKNHAVSSQIKFQEKDLLQGIDQTFDLLVANLPYIPRKKLETLAVFHAEPVLALDGGEDGLKYITSVLKRGSSMLNPGGAVFLELDEDCGRTALSLAKKVWPGSKISLSQDLAGQDRYLQIY